MRRDQRGVVMIELILAVAFLVLPAVGIAGAAVRWSPRVNAAQSAAYEAAKTAVAERDEAAGRDRAQEVWANHGFADAVEVAFAGDPTVRGGSVTATVTVELPVVRIPGGGQAGGFSWSLEHTERVPDYRSRS